MPRVSAHPVAAAAASGSAWRPLSRRGDVPHRVLGGRAAANRHACRGKRWWARFNRCAEPISQLSQPVPTSDHPLHPVGESVAGGGTRGGARGPLSGAACACAPRGRARRFLAPPRAPLIGHPPTATRRLQYPPLGGSGRPRRGAGAGAIQISSLAVGFCVPPVAAPRPQPRAPATSPLASVDAAWRRGWAAPGCGQTRHWRLGVRARPAGRTDQEKRLGARPSPRGRRPSLRRRPHRPPRPATPTPRAPSVGWRLATSPLSSPKRQPSPPVARLPFVQAPPTAMTLTTSARLFGALRSVCSWGGGRVLPFRGSTPPSTILSRPHGARRSARDLCGTLFWLGRGRDGRPRQKKKPTTPLSPSLPQT